MSTLGKDLATASALDENGAKISLGSFWADRKAVVVFVRYFDSASCRKLVSAMRDAQGEIESRHARLIVIGATAPDTMREFRDGVGYRGPLVVDPTLDAFRIAGMVPGGAPKTVAAPSAPAEAEPSGFFGKMKAALNADLGKLGRMDIGDALTADLVKLGQQRSGEASGAAASAPVAASGGSTSAHDSGVFVVGPGAATGFEWRAKAAGELPKLSELLGALPKK
jgi:peroxiredoxin